MILYEDDADHPAPNLRLAIGTIRIGPTPRHAVQTKTAT